MDRVKLKANLELQKWFQNKIDNRLFEEITGIYGINPNRNK